MVKTTKDIIKFLPFEEEFKKNLLEAYDNLKPEKKFNIGVMLWGAYDTIFQMKMQTNLEIAFEEARVDREKLDENFYKRVREVTEIEMNKLSAEDIKATDLDVAREKLQEIMTAAKE